jgi:hypothetical protein
MIDGTVHGTKFQGAAAGDTLIQGYNSSTPATKTLVALTNGYLYATRCTISGKVALAKDTVYTGILTYRSPARIHSIGNIGDTMAVVTWDSSGVTVLKAWQSRFGVWHKANGDSAYYGTGGGGGVWGEITGTLSNQSDLNTALLGKQNTSEKGAANGYPSLDANSLVPAAYMGGTGGDNSKYLRGDRVWTTFPSIPSLWDSASVAANSWAIRGNAVPANSAGYLYNNGSGTLSWATPAGGGGSGPDATPRNKNEWWIQPNAGLTTIANVGFATAPVARGTATGVRNPYGWWLNYASAAVADSTAGWCSFNVYTHTSPQECPMFTARVRIGAAAADTQASRIWVALTSAYTIKSSADPALNVAGFLFVPGTAGGWRLYTNDGTSTGTSTATNVLIALDAAYSFTTKIYAGAAATDSVVGFINGARVAVNTTNLPTFATTLGYHVMETTTGAAAKSFRVGKIHMENGR